MRAFPPCSSPIAARSRAVSFAPRAPRACRAIAVYSDADADALHVRLADAAVRIGPASPAQSYLSSDALIAAAKAAGAEAVHPGYGFLAEKRGLRANAARRPASSSSGRRRGDAGDGRQERGQGADDGGRRPVRARLSWRRPELSARFADEARAHRLSSDGEGERRRRRARHADRPCAARRSTPALRSASAEAKSAFGDGRLLLERALLGARHVEVQVFGDEHGAIVHLGERDCSIQRRHQKLIEESPSPAVSPELRARMGAAAVQAARAVGYVGAGTVEFLLDDDGTASISWR